MQNVVNNGLPKGLTMKDLRVGDILETRWEDVGHLLRTVVVGIEPHAHNFKGEFSMEAIIPENAEFGLPSRKIDVESSQVVCRIGNVWDSVMQK